MLMLLLLLLLLLMLVFLPRSVTMLPGGVTTIFLSILLLNILILQYTGDVFSLKIRIDSCYWGTVGYSGTQ